MAYNGYVHIPVLSICEQFQRLLPTLNIFNVITFQSEPLTVAANADGSINVPIKADASKIKIKFNPEDSDKPITVGPIDVKACSEPGM